MPLASCRCPSAPAAGRGARPQQTPARRLNRRRPGKGAVEPAARRVAEGQSLAHVASQDPQQPYQPAARSGNRRRWRGLAPLGARRHPASRAGPPGRRAQLSGSIDLKRLLSLALASVVASLISAPEAGLARPKARPRRPPPEQRHFDPSSSVWQGRVDAAEVLQGTLRLHVDALARAVRGMVSARDAQGLVRCAVRGTLTGHELVATCQDQGIGTPALVGTLRGRLQRSGATLRFEGTLRGRPLEGDIDCKRVRP